MNHFNSSYLKSRWAADERLKMIKMRTLSGSRDFHCALGLDAQNKQWKL